VKPRKLVDRGVVAGVVPEGPFVEERFARIDIPFENEVRIGGRLS
jgi:hypothetical protein